MQLTIDLHTSDLDELNEANEIIHRVINRRGDKLTGKVEEPMVIKENNSGRQGDESPDVTEGGLQLKPIEDDTAPTEDKHGRKWDDRIDSKPPKLTDKGEWRARRKPKDMASIEWGIECQTIIDDLKDTPSPSASVSDKPSMENVSGFESMLTNAAIDYNAFKDLVMDKVMNTEIPAFTPQFANEVAVRHGAENIQAVKNMPEIVPALLIELEL